jgi:hypothetical protein
MKYVIVKCLGVETARLGSEVDGHLSLLHLGEDAIAAGFCSLAAVDGEIKVFAWGQSQGVKAKSRGEEDAEIIEKTISFRS